MQRGTVAVLSLALIAGCGTPLRGEFRASGGALGAWELAPNRCVSSVPQGLLGADMFSTRSPDDTEVVAVSPGGAAPFVLVRVPGADHMLLLRASVCDRFQVDVHSNGGRLVEGSVLLECALPDGGHFSGDAHFTCF